MNLRALNHPPRDFLKHILGVLPSTEWVALGWNAKEVWLLSPKKPNINYVARAMVKTWYENMSTQNHVKNYMGAAAPHSVWEFPLLPFIHPGIDSSVSDETPTCFGNHLLPLVVVARAAWHLKQRAKAAGNSLDGKAASTSN